MRAQWLGVLKPRHPKSKGEWRAKILTAFVLAVILEVAILFGGVGIDTRDSWGTYTPATDEIWINPELDEYGTMVVTAHEGAHQAFYHLLPFWQLVKIPTAFLIMPILLLGLLIVSKRLWFIAGCLLFVVGLTEIHAYGITLLMFGVSEYTLPNLIYYGGLPIITCVAGLWIPRFGKKPEPKFKARYERFSRRDRRRLVVYVAVENYSILAMGIVIGYVVFVSATNWFVLLLMLANLFAFLWSKKKQRQMGVWIAKRVRVRARSGRRRKGGLRHVV